VSGILSVRMCISIVSLFDYSWLSQDCVRLVIDGCDLATCMLVLESINTEG
jgi:hypothetical protein